MVTRPNRRKDARRPLYIEEWMESLGLSDDALGQRIGVLRQTVYRWRVEQHRLNPEKMRILAEAMNLTVQDLFRPPRRRSVDALLMAATPEQIEETIAFVERNVLTGDT